MRNEYVGKIHRDQAIATPKPCNNCDTGDMAIVIAFTLSGEIALCERCYND
jgi:hypothetical protein